MRFAEPPALLPRPNPERIMIKHELMKKTIDTRGRLCPEPLILTRRAIAEGAAGDEFEVLTDNATACSNLRTYLTELGIAFEGDGEVIRFRLGASIPAGVSRPVSNETCAVPEVVAEKGDYCVAVAADRMGRGDDALGAILLRAFINALGEAERLPGHILCYNSGINVALDGSDTAEALRELEKRGVEVLVCGTCLDFYGATERLAAGKVSNMFRITEVLSKAGHVVYP